MALTTGTRLGPYEIVSAIGAGGMGEVYKARDTRLGRIVAVKVLAGHVAADQTFRDRFEREARTLSALDHPAICTLHDLGEAVPTTAAGSESGPAVQFLVMQYLEGETLADRLARAALPKSDPGVLSSVKPSGAVSMARGPLPLDQTLRYAAQIAQALDAAHRRGIVHRDLKPGNVMITKAGVKLLDFGLAKLRTEPVGGLTMAVTQAAPLTGEGSLLGTLQYMSPEQLHGGDIDARSDIFAFGAMLFEMLTGRRVFEGKSQAGTIAAILENDPPPLTELADLRAPLPPSTHRALERLVRKSLEKNPDDRWQSAADLADEIQWIDQDRLRAAGETDTVAAPAAGPEASSPARRSSARWWILATAASLLAALALGGWILLQPDPVVAPTRFIVQSPDGQPFPGPGGMAISPDGRKLAFVVGPSEQSPLWIRSLESVTPRMLPGTEGAWQPTWSPDGRYVVFQDRAGTKLKKIDVSGGPPATLIDGVNPGRVAWSTAGVILFRGDGNKLFQIPESGGTPVPVTELDPTRQEAGHWWPVFLPDGRRFIFLAQSSNQENVALFLGALDSKERTHLLDVQSCAEYSNGHLLYHREGTLMAHPFDEKSGRLSGGPIPIAENVVYNTSNGRAAFSVSTTGVLAYLTGDAVGSTQLQWFDPSGKPGNPLGPEANYGQGSQSVSAKGDRVAVTRAESGGRPDIWLIDVARGIPTRFTFDDADDTAPVWSPDDQSIVFRSNRNLVVGLYQRSSGGAGGDEVLFASPEGKVPTGFSPDGKILLFNRDGGAGKRNDIWALPMTGKREPYQVLSTPYNEGYAVFSPDGRWIAYDSDDAGTTQVYVQSFPPGATKIQLSTSGGQSPRWSADGKRIVYIDTDGYRVMSVDVAITGETLRASVPQELFVQPRTTGNPRLFGTDATLTRFLIPIAKTVSAPDPLTVVLNWSAGLAEK